MKNVSLLICFVFMSNCLMAQRYQLLKDSLSVYLQGNNRIETIKIDSVHNGVSFLNKQVNEYSDNDTCHARLEGGLLGEYLSFGENDQTMIVNAYDTTMLYLDAPVGVKWKANRDDSAMVKSVEYLPFLSYEDSVKTIVVGGNVLKVSLNHGLVQTYSFNKRYREEILYTLVGTSIDSSEVFDLRYDHVFDFEVGDEFHIHELEEMHGLYSHRYEGYSKHKVNSVEDRTDSVCYLIEETFEKENYYEYEQERNEERSGMVTIRRCYPKILLRGESGVVSDVVYPKVDYLQFKDDTLLVKVIGVRKYTARDINGENCYDEIPDYFNASQGGSRYYLGLGGPYYQNENWNYDYAPDVSKRELVYYKKGDREWGTPLTITSGYSYEVFKKSFKVFPNPVASQLTVLVDAEVLSMDVTSLSGQVVSSGFFINTLNVSSLEKGVYLLKVKTAKGEISTKFFKR